MITFQLLTGKNPFHAMKAEDVRQKILKSKPENIIKDKDLESVSQEAKDFIFNCLCKDINKRFSANKLLDHAWMKKQIDKEVNPEIK